MAGTDKFIKTILSFAVPKPFSVLRYSGLNSLPDSILCTSIWPEQFSRNQSWKFCASEETSESNYESTLMVCEQRGIIIPSYNFRLSPWGVFSIISN